MKTLKANNYQQALKEVNALDSEKSGIIKEEINFDDRKHYHVAMVRITDRPGQAKNDVSVNVQMFHESGFQKLEKNFQILGFNKLIIVHDPKQNADEETIAPESGTIDPPLVTKTQEEIEAEIVEKANQLFEARMAEFESKKGNETKVEEKQSNKLDSDQQLEFFGSATIDQLREYAKDNEIGLSGLKAKEDIKLAILEWYQDQGK